MIPEKYRGRFYEFRRMSGIYKITNTVNGNCYIGRSIDIMKRFDCHYAEIQKGYRGNKRWAEDILLHGKDAFDYGVLEEIPWNEPITLGRRERWWFSYLRPQYNREYPQIPYPEGWHVVNIKQPHPLAKMWIATHETWNDKSWHLCERKWQAWGEAWKYFHKNPAQGRPISVELANGGYGSDWYEDGKKKEF